MRAIGPLRIIHEEKANPVRVLGKRWAIYVGEVKMAEGEAGIGAATYGRCDLLLQAVSALAAQRTSAILGWILIIAILLAQAKWKSLRVPSEAHRFFAHLASCS